MKYSAFDRELLGVFLAIRHFRHLLEGRCFIIWTDHKPLCSALSSSAEKSPRQTRHLSFISEFSTDVRHVSGASNVVADALSRSPTEVSSVDVPSVDALLLPPAVLSVEDLAAAQASVPDEMADYSTSSNLRLEWCTPKDGLLLPLLVPSYPGPWSGVFFRNTTP